MMHISLTTEKEDDKTQICNIGIALSSPLRVAILSQLKEGEKSITELAKLNYVSVSSILFHLRLLENAGLVNIVSVENNNRIRRYASISCFTISMIFNSENKPEDEYKIYKSSQRVGEYVNANFGTKSGLITTSEAFLLYDNKPFIPERINAELVYTNYGFVEYAFNNDFKSSCTAMSDSLFGSISSVMTEISVVSITRFIKRTQAMINPTSIATVKSKMTVR